MLKPAAGEGEARDVFRRRTVERGDGHEGFARRHAQEAQEGPAAIREERHFFQRHLEEALHLGLLPDVKERRLRKAPRAPAQVGELPAIRQGYGVLNARAAIEAARCESHSSDAGQADGPRVEAGRLVFTLHDDLAETAAVAASFDGWDPGKHPMARGPAGLWRAEMDLTTPGLHRYKVVIDGRRWVPDPSNGRREADPYGGFESIWESS